MKKYICDGCGKEVPNSKALFTLCTVEISVFGYKTHVMRELCQECTTEVNNTLNHLFVSKQKCKQNW